MSLAPKYLAPGEAEDVVVVVGDRLAYKAKSEDTGGAFTAFEILTPPGGGPPRHVHTREDETFYVLRGEYEFWLGGETVRAGPGTFVFGPRGVPHTMRNISPEPGLLLCVSSPAGIEHFFAELAPLTADGPPDLAALKALGDRYGITFL